MESADKTIRETRRSRCVKVKLLSLSLSREETFSHIEVRAHSLDIIVPLAHAHTRREHINLLLSKRSKRELRTLVTFKRAATDKRFYDAFTR